MHAPLTSHLPRLSLPRPIKPQVTEEKPQLVDRVVLNTKTSELRLYLRRYKFKKCVSNLSKEQVKSIIAAIDKADRAMMDYLSIDSETFIVSPDTETEIK